jgi:hypothetical protein
MILGHHESSENTAAVSVGQNVESAINNVFPSALIGRKPFPGVLPSSRLFGLIYRSWTLKWIEQYYQTDMWTMWGISYALFGWVGGLIVNLIMGFGIGLGYARLQGVPTVAGRLLTMWALFSVYHLFVSFGLDVTFAISVYTLVGGLTAVALIQPRALPRGRDGIWPSGFDVAGAAWIPLHE